jgi:hypothetical protein
MKIQLLADRTALLLDDRRGVVREGGENETFFAKR